MPRRLLPALPCCAIFAIAGCGPNQAESTLAAIDPPSVPAKEAKPTSKGGKLTDAGVREVAGGETYAGLCNRWGKPVWYYVGDGGFGAGWFDVAAPIDGEPVVTLIMFNADGAVYKDGSGKVAGGHLKKGNPVPEGKRVDREDLKKSVIGWCKDDVLRVLGRPTRTTTSVGTCESLVFPARTFDKATGDKPDDDFTVSLQDGYCTAIFFSTKD